jgi:S-layer protein
MDSNGTLVLDGSGSVTVAVDEADTGAADVLNVEADVATSDYNYGVVTAADVETINISATDTNVDEDKDGTEYETGDRDATTLTLTADSATTVNVTGNADVDLTLTGSTKVTMIDGSTMTGALDVTSVTTSDPVTIKGGDGGDTLVAAGTEDVIMGGAGADTITGSDLTEMTGGEGNDTFIANTPTNVNSYSIIMDFSSGDIIDFSNVTSTGNSFVASEVTLGGTAVFQDLANAAVNKLATNDDDIAWFQFDDNNDGTSDTYIVVNDNQADAVDANFENGTDSIIKIMGEVDLSADATFNATDATLQMA